MPVGVQVGLLQRIFGLGVVAQDGAGHAEQLRVVAAHQALESRVIASSDAPGELGVVGVIERGRP